MTKNSAPPTKSGLAGAYLSLAVVIILWGSSFASMKYVLSHHTPYFAMFLRMGLASLAFLPFYTRLKHVRPRPGDLRWLIALGLCEPCIYFVLEANALRFTSASQAGLVASFYPILVAVSAAIFLKESIGSRSIFGFALAIGGVAALSWLGRAGEPNAVNPVLGNGMEFGATLFAAAFAIITRRLAPHYPPFYLALFSSFCGFIFFAPLAAWELFTTDVGSPNLPAFLCLLHLGVLVTALGMLCFSHTMKYISASRTAAAVNLAPLVGLACGVLLLGDTLSFGQYVAAAVILLGVVLSQSRH